MKYFFRSYAKEKYAQSIPLTYVEPTKSLLIYSMPCERMTAKIRNKAVAAIEADKIKEIAYRYLQSRHGVDSMRHELKINVTFIFLCLLAIAYLKNNSSTDNSSEILHRIIFVFLLLFICKLPPAFMNQKRLKETEQACFIALTQLLSDESSQRIANLPYVSKENFDTYVSPRVDIIIMSELIKLKKQLPPCYHDTRINI